MNYLFGPGTVHKASKRRAEEDWESLFADLKHWKALDADHWTDKALRVRLAAQWLFEKFDSGRHGDIMVAFFADWDEAHDCAEFHAYNERDALRAIAPPSLTESPIKSGRRL